MCKIFYRIISLLLVASITATSGFVTPIIGAFAEEFTENASANTSAVNNEIFADLVVDGCVDIADIVYLKRGLANWDGYFDVNSFDTTNPAHLKYDIDGDNEISIADVIYLKRHLVEWKDYLELGGEKAYYLAINKQHLAELNSAYTFEVDDMER
jgi:hypothetical protein